MGRKIELICLMLVACLSLTGCRSSDYKEALELEETKDYYSAVEIYGRLGDYKDSAEHLDKCNSMIIVIEDYNRARSDAEKKNEELETAVSVAEELILEKQPALDNTLAPALETAISETRTSKKEIPEMPETEDEIVAVTKEINEVDYSGVLSNLSEKQQALEKSIKQYALVDAPDESYIIECLRKVSNIENLSAVTEDNDPNGNLNKAGGYTSQVFFACDLVEQEKVIGDTIIEKGTDCGGSIEVYLTAEEANMRNTYLSTFDGGIFASGSHTVIGTVLVRTSNLLTASQQKELEANIIAILTEVED